MVFLAHFLGWAGQGADQRLAIDLKCDSQIVPYEPITMTVTICNNSLDPIAVKEPHLINVLQFYCATEAGSFSRCYSEMPRIDGRCEPMLLLPGKKEVKTFHFYLFSNDKNTKLATDLVLCKPGSYRLKVAREDVESNEAVLVVVKPSTADEEAARLAVQSRVSRFMMQMLGSAEEGTGPLREIADKYPESRLADYANSAMGGFFWGKIHEKYTPPFTEAQSKAALDAFRCYSAVSTRHPSLKAWAFCRQIQYANQFPEVRKAVDLSKLQSDLDANASIFDGSYEYQGEPRESLRKTLGAAILKLAREKAGLGGLEDTGE